MAKQVTSPDKQQFVLIGIIILLITGLVFVFLQKPNTIFVSDPYKFRIDSLNVELKNIKQHQLELDNQIKSYKDSLIFFDHKIDSINNRLTETRNYYGKKIRDIAGYNSTELYEFFSERYK